MTEALIASSTSAQDPNLGKPLTQSEYQRLNPQQKVYERVLLSINRIESSCTSMLTVLEIKPHTRNVQQHCNNSENLVKYAKRFTTSFAFVGPGSEECWRVENSAYQDLSGCWD